MQSIYHYLDYREYLRDFFEWRKKEQPWFSFKVFGDGVSLDQSQVFRILQGKLQISVKALPRFVSYLGLDERQGRYFAQMVAFARARKEPEARALFSSLLEMRGSRCRTLVPEQYELYREWYFPVVRTLLGILRITNNYEVLARNIAPPITVVQARRAVEFLRRLGLIQRDSRGVWCLTGEALGTGSEYHSLMVRQYQAHSFHLAEESLERHDPYVRDVNVINMALDEAAFHDCLGILRNARHQIRQRLERVNHPDRVYRLAQAFFPVSSILKETK
ncbi:MAG TPA: TIGR02147 family protein [Fibrobacteraceae bacterium]|nr:TIGR02147 family protein [Fibrobacteraceae bacterium]